MTMPSSGSITASAINAEYLRGYSMSSYLNTSYFKSDVSGATIPPEAGWTGPYQSRYVFPSSGIRYNTFYSTRRSTPHFASFGYSGVNQTTYTWDNVSYGPADASRILVLIGVTAGGSTVTNPTINGVTPNLVVASTNVSTLNFSMKIWSLAVPSAATGQVKIVGSGSNGAAYVLFALYGYSATARLTGPKGSGTAFPSIAFNAYETGIFVQRGNPLWSGTSGSSLEGTCLNYGNGNGNNPFSVGMFYAAAAGTHQFSNNLAGDGACQYAVFSRQ